MQKIITDKVDRGQRITQAVLCVKLAVRFILFLRIVNTSYWFYIENEGAYS